jgi:hypothetical protein
MGIEELLAANTAALEANTAAHAKLAEVAMAAAGSATGGTTSAETPAATKEKEAPAKETAAAKKKRLAAEKKAEAEAEAKAKAAVKPEISSSVSAADLKKAAAGFLKGDDEEARDLAKQNFIGALEHLGCGKSLSSVEEPADRAKLAGYIAYWQAGLDVDFDEIDAIIDSAGDGEEDGLLD